MTYVLLCCLFVLIAGIVGVSAVLTSPRLRASAAFGWPSLLMAAAVLLVLTAIFDSVMIAVGLFSYAEEKILGLRIGLAPLEDFSYPVAAVILLPALWVLFARFAPKDARP